ncbi:putative ubiquitin-conjugating enzyme E2 16 [Vitis vinifera]|uniref:Putative ubiquitin-conjugating enzyme E2 16 n=1 Tax=Vitis vinifera TaxID=29760 RepID=A0A438EVJ9_VITVI|nr:putative ubiquitin-conjugating enzyme E2 16 [Vitis vinifera]
MARCVCTNLDEQRLEVAVESDTTPLSLIHFSERLADAGDDPLLQSSVPRLCCWLTFSLDALVEGAAVVVIYLKSPLYLEMGMVSFALHLGNRHLALGKVLCQTCGTFYNYGMVHDEEMELWEVMGRRDGRMRRAHDGPSTQVQQSSSWHQRSFYMEASIVIVLLNMSPAEVLFCRGLGNDYQNMMHVLVDCHNFLWYQEVLFLNGPRREQANVIWSLFTWGAESCGGAYDILYDSWSPAMTVSSICISILSMLSSSTVKQRPEDNDRYVRNCRNGRSPRRPGGGSMTIKSNLQSIFSFGSCSRTQLRWLTLLES